MRKRCPATAVGSWGPGTLVTRPTKIGGKKNDPERIKGKIVVSGVRESDKHARTEKKKRGVASLVGIRKDAVLPKKNLAEKPI